MYENLQNVIICIMELHTIKLTQVVIIELTMTLFK